MGDLQAQLEEMRRLWEEERQAKERAQIELDVIRAGGRVPMPAPNASNTSDPNPNPAAASTNPNQSSNSQPGFNRDYHPSDRHHHSGMRNPDGEEADAVEAAVGGVDADAEGEGDEEEAGEQQQGSQPPQQAGGARKGRR